MRSSWALSLCLTACGTAVPEPERLPEGENTGPEVSYIPLDDRPVNADRVVYLAESLGYRLTMPEEDLYRTRLDGQDPNPNGTALRRPGGALRLAPGPGGGGL